MSQSKSPEQVLKEFWGYDTFRPLQKEIIESVISNHDTFALLPTGGGKSLCYQVPALLKEGICIVISPLISLMNDQVDDLKKRGIKALLITSSLSHREIDLQLDNAIYGDFKFIYVSPERLQNELFLERFKKMNVSFIAVDEAHCISQWGFDFRPSYRNIKELRNIHRVPILALTATATPLVSEDVKENLELKDVNEFQKSFSRNNIFFEVKKTENKFQKVVECIGETSGSGIIYVRNRRKCKEISDVLNHKGIKSIYYHAGLSHDLRKEGQELWMKNEVRLIVATNAFGMGIDKSDVRFVIHWDLPDSLEAFYQEAGRAGRDGKNSRSLLLYSDADLVKLNENFAMSFPSIEKIEEAYIQLANFFQLAEGSAYMQTFAFQFDDYCERYKLPKQMAYHALKQLELSGLILFSDSVFHPSTVKITGGLNEIMLFQNQNEKYQRLLSYLLRAFSGIIESEVKVNEHSIANKIDLPAKEVRQKLNYLGKIDLIDYKEASEYPSITFLQERKKIQDINISKKDYEKRKDAYSGRMDVMIKYIQSERCRNKIVLEYFGESSATKCGHCDQCKKEKFVKTESSFFKELISFIGKSEVNDADLKKAFPKHNPDEIQKACRELCKREVLVQIDASTYKVNS